MNNTFLSLMAAGLMLSSCTSKHVLSTKSIQQYQLTNENLASIQFYNSQDIVLSSYKIAQKNSQTQNGMLSLETGKEVDQVIIRANTPGKIVKRLDNGSVAVSFEPDDKKYLIFGRSANEQTYRLKAAEWTNGRGKINYGGKTYFTNAGADRCFIDFQLKRKHSENRSVRFAKGNKL